MERIQGYVDHIIYRNSENGYTVLALICGEEKNLPKIWRAPFHGLGSRTE